ncbi:Mitochondrial acidic protein mam33 [Entomortierella beljakovae]|nr:Mitochondrial acidic protein mam33 [Entomortierella beljakovae]
MFTLRTVASRVMPALAMRTAVAIPKAAVSPALLTRMGSVSIMRTFSNTPRAWSKTDKDLVSVLETEIKHEEEQGEDTPDYITEYLKTGAFKITDKPGSDEVVLTRKFGDEDIKIVFSVSDINSADDDEDLDMEELEDGEQQQSNQTLGASGDEEEGGEGDDLDSLTFPVRCLITITKPAGSISIDAIAQDGSFIVESISNIKDNALAAASTAESDWEKRGLYSGPPFAELDENLQIAFEKFLEERQIDGELANFVPNYVFHKDQIEYTSWLKELKNFVSSK